MQILGYCSKNQWLYNCNDFKKLQPKIMKTLGIVVLALGIIMTIFTGFNIITKEKVVDIGPLEINKEEKTPIYWSPITGGVLIVAGAIILVAGRKGT
jgi:hypothetical protein